MLADNFASISFVWLLLESGGGAVATSILFFVTLIPEMLLGLFVSPLLARGRLNVWMFGSDAVRALIMLVIPLCYYYDFLPIWLFFVAGFIQSACGSVYNPASVALLPRLVERSHVQKANAFMASANQVVFLVGLAGAGVLVNWLSSVTTMVVTSGVFLISGLLLLFLRPNKVEAPTPTESVEQIEQEEEEKLTFSEKIKSYWKEVLSGFTILRKHKTIFAINVYATFLNFGMAPFLALLAVYVTEELQGDAGTLSLLRGSLMVGALLMGIVLSKLKIKRYFALFIFAGLCQGLALTVFEFSSLIWVIVLCCAIIGMVETAVNVPEMVLIQTTVPPNEQPAIYAAGTALATSCLPIAALIVGPLAEAYGVGTIIACGGVLIIGTGILVRLFLPVDKTTAADANGQSTSS
ncbi:MFS transporter [Tumebacillus lipolyticus]|uniref:MFS transporter n=1 Tax=Tumebacillus lipolyticus TaxID=1280370 RepID=A0ABW4ZT22_9BACL